jgi:hypothetical protein
VAGTIVCAVVAGVDASIAPVVAGLDASIAAIVADLGRTLTALHLRRRPGSIGANRPDLDALALAQSVQPGEVVKASAGRDVDGRQRVAMLAVSDRERARSAIDCDNRALDVTDEPARLSRRCCGGGRRLRRRAGRSDCARAERHYGADDAEDCLGSHWLLLEGKLTAARIANDAPCNAHVKASFAPSVG